MLKNWIRRAAAASGARLWPAKPVQGFPFQSIRSFADAASAAPWISLINGVRIASSHLLQAAQAKGQEFDLELSIVQRALESLDYQTLPRDIHEWLGCRVDSLVREAENFKEPSFIQQLKDGITLHAARDKFRAELTSFAVFVLLACQPRTSNASRGLPVWIWDACDDASRAEALAERWKHLPLGLRPVCYTTADAIVPMLERTGAFLHVRLCSEDELQKVRDVVAMPSVAFWTTYLESPTSRAEIPFQELSAKCTKDVARLQAESKDAQAPSLPVAPSKKVGSIAVDLKKPRLLAMSDHSAIVGSWSSGPLLVIDPTNPSQPPQKIELPCTGRVTGLACRSGKLAASWSTPEELHVCDLKFMSWTKVTEKVYFPQGLSMDGNAIYWAEPQKHTVRCWYKQTGDVHDLMGIRQKQGRGQPGEQPEGFLLNFPCATALLGDILFIADYGNQRVLSFDMKTREIRSVYQGASPNALVAKGGVLYVHDWGKHQIFSVCLNTLEAQPVMGTGAAGFSTHGLPPLATPLQYVGPGGLAIGTGGELLVADEGNGVVRSLSPAGEVIPAAAAYLPASTEDWASANLRMAEPAVDEQGNPHQLMPYFPADWHTQPQLQSQIHMSPKLSAKATTALTAKFARPQGDLCIMLTPLRPRPRTLDAYFIYTPEWDDSTCLETHANIRKRGEESAGAGSNSWLSRMRAALKWLKTTVLNADDGASKKFYFRQENFLEIEATCKYNEEEDSNTWSVSWVNINGKSRGGSLEGFTVGVDVPVAFFLISAEGTLQLLSKPTLQ